MKKMSEGLIKVVGKKRMRSSRLKAAYKGRFALNKDRPVMTSSSDGPGTMSNFCVNGKLLFELVEWKEAMFVNNSGLWCDGRCLVAFEPTDRWSCGTMSATSNVIKMSIKM